MFLTCLSQQSGDDSYGELRGSSASEVDYYAIDPSDRIPNKHNIKQQQNRHFQNQQPLAKASQHLNDRRSDKASVIKMHNKQHKKKHDKPNVNEISRCKASSSTHPAVDGKEAMRQLRQQGRGLLREHTPYED